MHSAQNLNEKTVPKFCDVFHVFVFFPLFHLCCSPDGGQSLQTPSVLIFQREWLSSGLLACIPQEGQQQYLPWESGAQWFWHCVHSTQKMYHTGLQITQSDKLHMHLEEQYFAFRYKACEQPYTCLSILSTCKLILSLDLRFYLWITLAVFSNSLDSHSSSLISSTQRLSTGVSIQGLSIILVVLAPATVRLNKSQSVINSDF